MLTNDTDDSKIMSPLVVVNVGHQEKSTSVCKRAGKNPQWNNEQLYFNVVNEPEVKLTVLFHDDNIFNKEYEFVGQATFYMANILDIEAPRKLTIYNNEGRPAGTVTAIFDFHD